MDLSPLRRISDTPRVLRGQPGLKRYNMLKKIKNARWIRIADAISEALEDTHKYREWEYATCGGKAGPGHATLACLVEEGGFTSLTQSRLAQKSVRITRDSLTLRRFHAKL